MSFMNKIRHALGGDPAPAAWPLTPADGPRRPPLAPAEVEALLAARAAAFGRVLDWHHSAGELMTLLGLDTSLAGRRRLAELLGYDGSLAYTAGLNNWLRRKLLEVLAENGGTLPGHLREVRQR